MLSLISCFISSLVLPSRLKSWLGWDALSKSAILCLLVLISACAVDGTKLSILIGFVVVVSISE